MRNFRRSKKNIFCHIKKKTYFCKKNNDMDRNTTAKLANEIMASYVRNSTFLTDGKDISGQDDGDDIHGACADYRAYSINEKKYVYFEVKGTTVLNPIWGAITDKEIKSALEASTKGYLYFFSVIYIKNSHDGIFVHPKRNSIGKELFSDFMTLEEIMSFSKRAKISVDFEMNCARGKLDDPQKVRFRDKSKKPFSVQSVENAIKNFNL